MALKALVVSALARERENNLNHLPNLNSSYCSSTWTMAKKTHRKSPRVGSGKVDSPSLNDRVCSGINPSDSSDLFADSQAYEDLAKDDNQKLLQGLTRSFAGDVPTLRAKFTNPRVLSLLRSIRSQIWSRSSLSSCNMMKRCRGSSALRYESA